MVSRHPFVSITPRQATAMWTRGEQQMVVDIWTTLQVQPAPFGFPYLLIVNIWILNVCFIYSPDCSHSLQRLYLIYLLTCSTASYLSCFLPPHRHWQLPISTPCN